MRQTFGARWNLKASIDRSAKELKRRQQVHKKIKKNNFRLIRLGMLYREKREEKNARRKKRGEKREEKKARRKKRLESRWFDNIATCKVIDIVNFFRVFWPECMTWNLTLSTWSFRQVINFLHTSKLRILEAVIKSLHQNCLQKIENFWEKNPKKNFIFIALNDGQCT